MKRFLLLLLIAFPVVALPPTEQRTYSEEELSAILARVGAEKKILAMEDDERVRGYSATNVKRLVLGDDGPLHEAFQKRDMMQLWHYFEKALYNTFDFSDLLKKYGDGSPELLREMQAVNARVREVARNYLSQIPGHAKWLGDRIDKWSDEPGHGDSLIYLHRLGQLGTMEAIQQIGRFIEDPRMPEYRLYNADSGIPASTVNWMAACVSMHHALGADSPLGGPGWVNFKREHYEKIIAWWKSDEARPYREWNYELGYTLPPARPLPPLKASPPQTPKAADAKVALADTPQSVAPAAWPYLLGFAALILLITWLSAKRRPKTPDSSS